jgi:hypothetical protein
LLLLNIFPAKRDMGARYINRLDFVATEEDVLQHLY